MNYEIITSNEIKVVGTMIRTTNENFQSIKDQQKLWNDFFQNNLGEKIPNIINKSKMYGVYYNYESDFTKPYNYLIGFEVKNFDNIPENMSKIIFKKGEYAKFNCEGDNTGDKISSGWQSVWNTDIKRQYLTDLEEYDLSNQNADINILIGIK